MKQFKIVLALVFCVSGMACSHGGIRGEGGRRIASLEELPRLPEHYSGTCTPDDRFCAYFAPTEMPIQAVGEYLRSAKQTIRIATYNMNVGHYIDILKDRLNHGVRVEFMVDYKLSVDYKEAKASNSVWRALSPHPLLTRYRLPVMRGKNPQMHNKVIIIDGRTVLFGSANWTYSGLVANYENVLAVRAPEVVQKFGEELDELRDTAQVACGLFATDNKLCGSGRETWDRNFEKLLVEGTLSEEVVKTGSDAPNPQCNLLTKLGFGLLNEMNQGKFSGIADCIKDPRYGELIQRASGRERFSDQKPAIQFAFPSKHPDQQTGPLRVYFSPEDDVEGVIIRELQSTYKENGVMSTAKASKSFAYISTNFITNAKFAQTLVEMKKAGVRMKIFFDRGRIEDTKFQVQVDTLKPVGFTQGETGISSNLITIFNNTLTGPEGCNHNKLAVIGTPAGIKLLNGSANWSSGAMTANDENLVVIEDEALASIYLREILSQLYVYRYFQKEDSVGYKDDLAFLSKRARCLPALLGDQSSCVLANGKTWRPVARSSAILSVDVKDEIANAESDSLWAWVPQLNNNQGGAAELFTHRSFAGKWVTSVPLPPGWTMNFKFFKLPKGTDGNSAQDRQKAVWEYGGSGNDRILQNAQKGVHVIRGMYTWGKP